MKPWVRLDTATVPGGGGELRLMQRDSEFSIMAGAITLMNSRMSGSETALAELACDRLRDRPNCRVLIGGYGMGFTLRAVLAGLGAKAQVVVAELVPAVLEWARGPMAAWTAGCLDDPRVHLIAGDVAAVIGATIGSYDAILLDVDNGPDGVTRDANNQLYSMRGLALAKVALKPGGILAVWSARPDASFARRLKDVGFKVEEICVRARGNGKGPRHVIWFCRLR